MANVAYSVWITEDLETRVDPPNAYRKAIAIAKLAAREHKKQVRITVSDSDTKEPLDRYLTVEPDGTVTEHN
ncbi:MAG: hypothetical protein ACJ72Z_10230 [Pyrinomonadaceae bacterium]